MALHLVSRLTGEVTAQRVQRAIDHDPEPPFGGIDWDHIDLLSRVMLGWVTLAVPAIAANPKQLLRSERKVDGGAAGASWLDYVPRIYS